ncbi:MAG: polyphosphate kinase 1 [Vicinamibacteria bacterium]
MKAGRSKKRERREPKEPELFINRELSWLEFNGRVLEEALDASNPLLERLKFATIVASNLDEFFMVRVAALRHALQEGDTGPDHAGLSPERQLTLISERVHEMVGALYGCLGTEILPALRERGIRIAAQAELDAPQQAALSRLFRDEVLPALTPLAIDASRPFPMLANLSLNVALLVEAPEGEEGQRLAVVQVPAVLPRLVRPLGAEGTVFVLLEDVIRTELPALFPGQKLLDAAAFRIARDAEVELDDEGGRDYLEAVEEELRKRRRAKAVRLEVEAGVSDALLALLVERVGAAAEDVYRVNGPVDIRAFQKLLELPALEDLRDAPLRPLPVPEAEGPAGLFETLDQRDVVLHHPYDSFDPVIALVAGAAEDPDVLAIKQTLYRTSGDSPIVRALSQAAEAGKQVTVLVELMARFDEQSNIRWARSLEEAGAHVIYGIRGFKTHSKICLVVRRGRDGIRRYVHLGTGNYNDRTARLYTDFGLMTSNREIGEDASAFFNALTGYSDPPQLKKLAMAPTGLRERTLALVERERRRAEAGQAAEIRAKMNSLVDEDIIRALYEASRAGVRIQLNVRGICCLRPGVKGASESIEVVSVVDRFLEHARIFQFRNGGDEEVYLSSADWMPRNLDRRIELMFPLPSGEIRQKALAALDAMFQDNVKARVLQADGCWKRRRPARGEAHFRAQLELHAQAQRAVSRARAATGVTLEPLTSPS